MDPSSPRSSSSSTLQRGKACLNCRRRKMKCDGVRPVCGPCSRSNRSDDCEYTDGQGRTRTQILEENIAQLEARIHELENPESASASVTLHDPHSAYFQSQHGSPSSGASSPAVGELQQYLPYTALWQSADWAPSAGIGGPSLHSSGSDAWWEAGDPPLHIVQELLDVFFRHSSQLSWFLHIIRFRHTALLPRGNANRPLPALLYIVFLWGIAFSHSDELTAHEPALLARTLSLTGHSVVGTPSHQIMQAIQAKILLANYLFRNGRFFEGRHQSDSAAALAVSCGLHKIRSAQQVPAFPRFIDPVELGLPEPRDQIEEGERINGFWAIFCMDRCWAVAFGAPTVISDIEAFGMQIDTPWPLEMETYERGQIYPNLRTSGTLRNFLSGINTGWPWENHGTLTQMSKASALFERATRLASSWRPGIPNMSTFYADFVSVDQRIEDFKSQLFPLENMDHMSQDVVRLMHLTFCLAHASTIQLHAAFAQQNTASRSKCLAAGTAIVRANAAVRVHEFTDVSSIVGTVWAAVGRVIINEIATLRSFHAESTPSQPQRETELRAALDQLQATMAVFAPNCALISP
ncbi:hypothetical protein BV25DRAFT_1810255 [Artomyces pyxidatus]|uniref:Uncharacterized protein n=1 Tax=Artomyces pyxidatus TaxID=48021 RepID=A0ACB8SQK2_9AGAM|nr:hypothetical protein BV25DRAFT_1810255 [Artomyces pyxidatus]